MAADERDPDRYEAWYQEKLWELLPGIYRAEDSQDFDTKGPLREIVERIGTQIAVVRRSIDRLWEDQSIEGCDDWVIDYIGELVATNLVASLDAHGKRVDVGKTIYYRRRKGTVALLEELAGDISGWSVRVVEMFRRMGRTRHGLDPAIGLPAAPATPRGRLQRAQGLIGTRTGTGAGGYADLRNVHGAELTNGAFDEYFHTADVRRGRGPSGWHNIPHLGVFVWRHHSLGVVGVTPVQARQCKNQYTFDPTGRDIPLYASGDRTYGDEWVSPKEHEVPGPISRPLLQAAFTELYRSDKKALSLAVHRYAGGPVGNDYLFVPAAEISQDPRKPTGRFAIDPERGRIIAPVGTTDGVYRVDYHYGFASDIGAGPYDRRSAPDPLKEKRPEPAAPVPPVKNGTGLDAAIAAVASISIADSLTYAAVTDVPSVEHVVIRAANLHRPVIRTWPAKDEWVFTGANEDAVLELDGLFLGGGTDLVLKGSYGRVTLRCCTLDPGTWEPANPEPAPGTPARWKPAADDRALEPSWLRIEGNIRRLEIERCILGPVRATGTFGAEEMLVTDTIIHAADPAEDALALDLDTGAIALSRCTVLGRAKVHRIDASESFLHDVVEVDDTQHGCVRFSAWATGSTLPRRYESVPIEPRADLFVARSFGEPGFAQLVATTGSEILEGAEDGSEMGAFCREKSAIRERSILIKYQEYLPLGMEPWIVHVT
jgi:hypothetical protein